MANDEKAELSRDQTQKVPPRKVDPLLRDTITEAYRNVPDKGKNPGKSARKDS